MPIEVKIPDLGVVEFPDSMDEGQIGTAIRERIYKLPALPEMSEYNETAYRNRRFISRTNLQTSAADLASQGTAFEQMASEVKSGRATTDEPTILEAQRALKFAQARYRMAELDALTVEKDPAPKWETFRATVAQDALQAAGGVVDFFDQERTGKPFDPAQQPEYNRLNAERQKLEAQGAQQEPSLMFQPEYIEGGSSELAEVMRKIKALERPRETTLAGKLAAAGEQAFESANVNPNAPNFGAQFSRGAGHVVALAPSLALRGPVALPATVAQMGAQKYEAAYSQKANELRARGVTDEAQIDHDAQVTASKEAVVAVPELGVYMLGGKLASSAVSKMLPQASPLQRFFAGASAATGANVAAGGALRWLHGDSERRGIEKQLEERFPGWQTRPEAERQFDEKQLLRQRDEIPGFLPTVENLTQDALFGLAHGARDAQAAVRARGILQGTDPKVQELMTLATDSAGQQYAAALDARGRETGNLADVTAAQRIRQQVAVVMDRSLAAIDEAQAQARRTLGIAAPVREERRPTVETVPETPSERQAEPNDAASSANLNVTEERIQEGIRERQQQNAEEQQRDLRGGLDPTVIVDPAMAREMLRDETGESATPQNRQRVTPAEDAPEANQQASEAVTTPAEAPGVGEMVKMQLPGVSGPLNVAGRVERVLPSGKLEIRTQQHGIHEVDPGAVTRTGRSAEVPPAAEVPPTAPAARARVGTPETPKAAPAESRADIDAIAQEAGVRYDGAIEGTGAHQFTDPNLGTAGGATFTIRGPVTPETLAAKKATVAKAFGEKVVKDYAEAKGQPPAEKTRRAKVVKAVEAPSLTVQGLELPTLKPGEKQGDILSTQADPEPFRLIQEETIDVERRQRSAEQRERDLAEQDAMQSELFTADELNARLTSEARNAALAEVKGFEQSNGNELLATIKSLGGLPSISKESVLSGEVKRVWEANKGRMMKLVRRDQKLGLDQLNESLKQYGFKFETPADLLTALEGVLGRGERVIGYEPGTEPGLLPLRDIDRSKSGGFFGGGTRVRPFGAPPSGARHWLRVDPAWKRALPGGGLFTEGASIILQRQPNPIGKTLGRASDRQFDVEQELYGKMWKPIAEALQGVPRKARKIAFNEVSQFIREKENGRTPAPLSMNGRRLYSAWQDVAEFTGLLAQRSGVQVSTGTGYRPMRLLGREYIPRMFNDRFLKVIKNSRGYAPEFNAYVSELAAHRGVTLAEAAKELDELAGGKGRYASNDFMGNIEIARAVKMPESFYEYDLRKLTARYVPQYAQRMSQIISYGQRLEGGGRVTQKNLWDLARDEIQGGDKATSRWLNAAEAQSIGERDLSGIARAAAVLQSGATGLMLANPFTTVPRNLISGLYATGELLGMGRAGRVLTTQMLDSQRKLSAREAGAVRDDMAALLHTDRSTGDATFDRIVRGTSNFLLKVSGFNASEAIVRTHGFLTASQFARDFVTAAGKAPNGAKARQMAAVIKRMGVEPEDVIAERGDWRTGEQTRTFARKAIEQTQGGYKFNQVPLWANSNAGRFFYQFGRWATMRAQNIFENAIKPAIVGTETTIGGVKMSVRDLKPLLRLGLGTVLLGEAFAGLSGAIFGRDRRDATFTEIFTASKAGDLKRAATLLAGRLINDLLLSGMTGVYAVPADIGRSVKEGSRLKNPAEPPGAAGIKALINLGIDAMDQGAVTPDDLKEFLGKLAPGMAGGVDWARNVVDQPKYEAENDQRTLRNAGIRFADEKGLRVPSRRGNDRPEKTENTPIFAGIRDALIVGDVAGARRLRGEFLAKFKTGEQQDKAERSLRASVRNRQPMRVGPYTREDVQMEFMKWAQRRLPPEDVNQIRRVQVRYKRAAEAADLWADGE